jgi:hypothetical protein
METRSHTIDCLEDLRDYVNETLCEEHQLQVGAFQLTERLLQRTGKPCGMYFCLHGPRAVKFTAIWETDRNQVIFYGPSGKRFLTAQLHAKETLGPSEREFIQATSVSEN